MANLNKRRALVCAGLAVSSVLVAAAAQAQDVSFIARSDFDVGRNPQSVAVGDFNGDGVQDLAVANFVYVINVASNDISAYQIDASTGTLIPLQEAPFPTLVSPVYITLDSDSRFAYVAHTGGTAAVSTFSINPETGLLALVMSLSVAATSVTVTPNRKFAYVTNSTFGRVTGFDVEKQTGALVGPIQSPLFLGGNPNTSAVDPEGKFLYITNPPLNNVSALDISPGDGALTSIPGSPFVVGDRPAQLTVEPCGQFLYVTDFNSNDVTGYAIDNRTGALTQIAGSPFPTGRNPLGIAVDPLGRFLFVVNSNSDTVSVYAINRTTGALAQVNGSPFQAGRGPFSVAVDPTGKYLYTADFDILPTNASTVSGFAIDPPTGFLTPVPGSPFLAGRNAASAAITGRRVACHDREPDGHGSDRDERAGEQ